MSSLLFLGALSLLISLAVTPAVRGVFRRLDILDHPGNERKIHTTPIPRVGGVAILLSYVAAFGVLLCTHSTGAALVRSALPFIWKLLPAASLVFLVGFLDDIFSLRPWQKLAGQVAGAAFAYQAGIRITAVGGINAFGPSHSVEWWSCPVTILWLIICMNALNLIDGLDGLAGGIGLVTSVTTLLAALIQSNIALALAILPLVGCLLGFLRYNFNPATIFLGDSGSLFIGFLLGCFGVVWSEKSATMLGMVAPMMALSIPLTDTALAIGRRILRRKPIFGADRGHIHHRLLDLGFSPRQAALLLYGMCALFAVLSLAIANHRHELVIIGIFCLAVWAGVEHLEYVEFDVAGRALSEGWFVQLVSAQIALQAFESKLASAVTLEECWRVLRDSYQEFGFTSISAQLGQDNYSHPGRSSGSPSWHLDISLPGDNRLTLTACRSSASRKVFAPYADAIRRALEPKLGCLAPEDVTPSLIALARVLSVRRGTVPATTEHDPIASMAQKTRWKRE